MKLRVAVVLIALPLIGSGALAQEPVPAGSEFHVNTYTTDDQLRPKVVSGSAGDFIVVWGSNGSAGTDTDGGSIQGQRYSPGGAPNGAEFQINTFTTYWQFSPDVGRDSAGNFVVVWGGPNPSDSSNDRQDIRGQRFDANGAPAGDEFRVNSYSTSEQSRAAIAVAPDGSFVVVWDGFKSTESGAGVFGQRFAADATPLGSEFKVNTFTSGKQRFPAIAMDGDGDFVVVWESDGSAGTDDHGRSVQGQRFAANGTMLGGEFQVNTYTTNEQYRPGVAMGAAGDFVVVWESFGTSGSDNDFVSVQARRFDFDGTPFGDDFQVNAYTTRGQRSAEVAKIAGGAFVVAWQSYGSYGDDVDDGVPPDRAKESVQMRRFSADGMPLNRDFQVNTYTGNQQWYAAISVGVGSEFVVVWESRSDDPTNYLPFGIRGQRFEENLLFSSGFEFGDTADWSGMTP